MVYPDLLALFFRRWKVLAAVLLTTLAVHVVLLSMRPGNFQVDAIIRVRDAASESGRSGPLQGAEIFEPFSLAVLEQLLDNPTFDARVRDVLARKYPTASASSWSSSRLELDALPDGGFTRVSYSCPNPRIVLSHLSAALEAMRTVAQEHFETGIARGRKRLEARLDENSREMAGVEKQLAALREKAGLPQGPDAPAQHRKALLASIQQLDLKEVDLTGRCAELEARQRALVAAQPPTPDASTDSGVLLAALQGTPVYNVLQEISTELIRAELHVARERSEKTDKHPDLQEARRRLASDQELYRSLFTEDSPIRAHIQRAIQVFTGKQNEEKQEQAAELLAAQKELQAARTLREQKKAQLDKLRRFENDVDHLDDQRAVLADRRGALERGLDSLGLHASLTPEVVQVFRGPAKVHRKDFTTTQLLPLAFAMSLLLGIGVVYGVEILDHRIHDQHLLRKHSSLPLMGVVPSLDIAADVPRQWSRAPGVEAFNAILHKVLIHLEDGVVLLVTSPDPAAGKSFISSNLAVCAAEFGIRTLLIDGDLRQPRLHRNFALSRGPGLGDWLRGELTHHRGALETSLVRAASGDARLRLRPRELPAARALDVVLQPGPTGIIERPTRYDNLSLITSGTEGGNPGVLFETYAMDDLLENVRQRYQLCIIDTPPVNVAADALLLSGKVDGNILVVRAGHTSSQDLHWLRQGLADVSAPMLGTILNGLAHRAPGYYSYYDGRKYYRARS